MECTVPGGAAKYSIIARRNCSLSPAGRLLVFGAISAVSLGISLAFALLGAWPILPFAGLEMLALYLAFRYMGCHAGDFDRITFAGDRLTLESVDRNRVRQYEFNRHWTQVVVQCKSEDRHCRLALRSHGREVEFGRFLTDWERIAIAGRLRAELRNC